MLWECYLYFMPNRIFICDDTKDIVDLLASIFRFEFKEVLVFTETDSRNALSRMLVERPDILIVDIAMPWLSGDQLIRAIRKDPVLSQIFIICMSANLNGEELALEAGADVFLAKPFDLDPLFTIIHKVLSNL